MLTNDALLAKVKLTLMRMTRPTALRISKTQGGHLSKGQKVMRGKYNGNHEKDNRMRDVANKRIDKCLETRNDGIMRRSNGLVVIIP